MPAATSPGAMACSRCVSRPWTPRRSQAPPDPVSSVSPEDRSIGRGSNPTLGGTPAGASGTRPARVPTATQSLGELGHRTAVCKLLIRDRQARLRGTTTLGDRYRTNKDDDEEFVTQRNTHQEVKQLPGEDAVRLEL